MSLFFLKKIHTFDKSNLIHHRDMKTKLREKVKQIGAEYKLGDFFRNFIAVVLGALSSPLQEATG